MGGSRLVELPPGWVLPASPTASQVEVHGVLGYRGEVEAVAACGVQGCSPPWVEVASAGDGTEPGGLPGIAAHLAEQLRDHLRTSHGLARPNIGLLEPATYRLGNDWGREL